MRPAQTVISPWAVGSTIVGIIGIIATVWYCFFFEDIVDEKSLPVIKADTSPTKFRPDNAGETNVPHQDKLIYNRIARKDEDLKKVKLLSPPQTPVALTEKSPSTK